MISLDVVVNFLTILALICIWGIVAVLGISVIGRALKKCISFGVDFVLRDR